MSFFQTTKIDGQELRIFNNEDEVGLDEILLSSELLASSPVVKGLLEDVIGDIVKCKRLTFGIGLVNGYHLPYTILKVLPDKNVRVHLERVRCESCGKKTLLANPFVMDNWLGVSEDIKKIAIKSLGDLYVNCPNCSEQLNRNGFIITCGNKEV